MISGKKKEKRKTGSLCKKKRKKKDPSLTNWALRKFCKFGKEVGFLPSKSAGLGVFAFGICLCCLLSNV